MLKDILSERRVLKLMSKFGMETKGIIKYLSLNPCPVGNNPPVPLCMPDKYKTRSVVKSYRAYYKGDKKQIAKWTKRTKPTWFN